MTRGGLPLYEQVAAALRLAISRGDFDSGSPLPSEAELCRRHGVSRETVRKSLSVLLQEGLITGGQGQPRRIRRYAPFRWYLSTIEGRERGDSHGAYDAWAAEVTRQGRRPSETIDVGIVVPPDRVAQALGLDREADAAVVRRRVRLVDEQPYQIADSYFPETLARGTPLMEPRSVSAPGGVLAWLGHRQVRLIDEIAIRMPTADESARLQLPAATPVAEVMRTGFDRDGRPVRVMITVVPGDRTVLVYETDAAGA